MDKTKGRQWLILSGILVTGLMVRLYYLWRVGWVIDSDEAITGLMGRHILQGIRRPIFFYGQDYLGSLEAWFDALVFYLFGSSIVTLRVVPVIFGLLVILTTFMLAEILYERRAQRRKLPTVDPTTLTLRGAGKHRFGYSNRDRFFGSSNYPKTLPHLEGEELKMRGLSVRITKSVPVNRAGADICALRFMSHVLRLCSRTGF